MGRSRYHPTAVAIDTHSTMGPISRYVSHRIVVAWIIRVWKKVRIYNTRYHPFRTHKGIIESYSLSPHHILMTINRNKQTKNTNTIVSLPNDTKIMTT